MMFCFVVYVILYKGEFNSLIADWSCMTYPSEAS
jgi:hypothetical protein